MRVRNFRLRRNAHAHNFHYTPYLPTDKNIRIFHYYFVGRKVMELS